MNLVDILGSVVTGGVTGLIGTALSRFADFQTKKTEFVHEEKMRELDAAIMAQEWAAKTQVASIEADAVMEKADAEAFAKSFNEPERYSERVRATKAQGWVLIALDAIRGAVRPGLTVYLCAITTYLYWDAHSAMSSMGVMDTTKLVNQIVTTVLYLNTVSCTWWFGTRVRSKEK